MISPKWMGFNWLLSQCTIRNQASNFVTIQDLIGYFPENIAWNDSLDSDELAHLLLGMVYLEVSQQQRQLTRQKRTCRLESRKSTIAKCQCLQQVGHHFSNKTHKRNCL